MANDAEKVAQLGVKRDNTFMYFIKKGDLWRVPRRSPGGRKAKAERVAATGLEMDYGQYVYFLDGDGDIARQPRNPRRTTTVAKPRTTRQRAKSHPVKRPPEGATSTALSDGFGVASTPLPDDAMLAEEFIAVEGKVRQMLVQHRTRELKLRSRKIQDGLRLGGGRLRCEVPGCGFDFFAVYGEIGRDYAHVHHLRRLSERDDAGGPTTLTDLAIVCANCHAMIHQGGKSRGLAGLIAVQQTKDARRPAPRTRTSRQSGV